MAIALDQATIGEFALDSASSTIAITTDHVVAAGGFIVLAAAWLSSAGAPTLSSVSGGGLVWTIDRQGTGANGASIAVISAQAPSGLASSTTITATLSASSSGARSLVGSSFSGVAASSPVDVAGSVQTITAASAWTTGNLTVAAGSLTYGWAAGFTTNGGGTATAPSTKVHDVNGGASTFNNIAAYRIDAGGGTVASAGTFVNSQSGAAVGVAYLSAPTVAGNALHPSVPFMTNGRI